MNEKVIVYKEDVWKEIFEWVPILADSARIEVYWDNWDKKIKTVILQGQSHVEVDKYTAFLDSFESLSKFWTEYPYKLEDLVDDEEERERLESDEEAFEKFLLDIYEEEYLTNGLPYYKVEVPIPVH